MKNGITALAIIAIGSSPAIAGSEAPKKVGRIIDGRFRPYSLPNLSPTAYREFYERIPARRDSERLLRLRGRFELLDRIARGDESVIGDPTLSALLGWSLRTAHVDAEQRVSLPSRKIVADVKAVNSLTFVREPVDPRHAIVVEGSHALVVFGRNGKPLTVSMILEAREAIRTAMEERVSP